MVRRVLAAIVLVCVVLGGAVLAGRATREEGSRDATASPGTPCGVAERSPGRFEHVVWIVFENKSLDQIIGSGAAPYFDRLARRCGLATSFFAETRPSLPNYIALTSGSTQGVKDNGVPLNHRLSVPSIFSQLGRGGWRAYLESMPRNCELNNAPGYGVHHNPAAYYTNVRSQCRKQAVPLGRRLDISARLTYLMPNLCHSMHDCPIGRGDAWLARWMPKILDTPEYRSGRTAVFVTFDEDDGSAGNNNRIATLVLSPSTPRGTRSSRRFDHYSMLRTTEELLGIDSFLGAAVRAPSMRSDFGL